MTARHGAERLTTGALLLALAVGCEGRDGFSDTDWDAIEKLRPFATPMIPNPANKWADNLAVARFGQMLWFDPDFSTAIRIEGPTGKIGETGKVACVTCHDPKKSFVDTRTPNFVSHGTGFTARNSPALVNLGWYEWFTWGGRMDSLAMQGANAPEAGTDVATSRLFFAHVLYAKYRNEYNAIFAEPLDPALDPTHPDAKRFPPVGRPAAMGAPPGAWEMMDPADQLHINTIMANSGKAFEAYERQLVSKDSPFERWMKGENTAMSRKAKRGLALFIGKAACNECHFGPILTDNRFHNIGVPQGVRTNLPSMDHGRFQEYNVNLTNPFRSEGAFSDDKAHGEKKLEQLRKLVADGQTETLRGQFRTPALLNIADTPPYFHNGSALNLHEVVSFYNKGGGEPGTFSGVKDPKIVPLGLTAEEQDELVEFLLQLTGGPVPEEWAKNTAKPAIVPGP